MTIEFHEAGSGTAGRGVQETPRPASRSDRFLARIDQRIACMNKRERRAFLEDQVRRWDRLYDTFVKTGGESMPITDPNNPPQASDFTLVIAGLTARYRRV